MKTASHLWPELVSWPNMLLALQRCRRRKRYSTAAAEFDYDSMNNLLHLQRELVEDYWFPGPYYHFHITDPKPRKISAAPFRDRIVHHAIVNVLEPVFEPRFIFDSYACRRGKGTHKAILRAQQYLRRYSWSLKTDIVKFFPSIDHELLLQRICRTVRDPKVIKLLSTIIDSGQGVLADEYIPSFFPGDDLFSQLRPRGLPIGNLTSQFFANVYLDSLDHYIREELRVPGYVRYADDLVLFGRSRQDMWNYRQSIAEFAASLRLRLHAHKTHVSPCTMPLNFLGMRISRHELRLRNSGIRRFTRRIRNLQMRLDSGRIAYSDVQNSLRAWLAHCAHANTTGLVHDLLKRLRFRRRSAHRITPAAVTRQNCSK
jgi:retron-type reverse transcriptase